MSIDLLPDDLLVERVIPFLSGKDMLSLHLTNKRLRKVSHRVKRLHLVEAEFHNMDPSFNFFFTCLGFLRYTACLRELQILLSHTAFSTAFMKNLLGVTTHSLVNLSLSASKNGGVNASAFNEVFKEIALCNSLQELQLSNVWFSSAPIQPTSFMVNLCKLQLTNVELSDETLTDVLNLCPQIQYLDLFDCVGMDFPMVCTDTLKELKFLCSDLAMVDSLHIASRSLQLASVNGVLSLHFEDVPSLQRLHLMSYPGQGMFGYLHGLLELHVSGVEWPWISIHCLVAQLSSVESLNLSSSLREERPTMRICELMNTFESCRWIKSLTIGEAFLAYFCDIPLDLICSTTNSSILELSLIFSTWHAISKDLLLWFVKNFVSLRTVQVIFCRDFPSSHKKMATKQIEELKSGLSNNLMIQVAP